MPVVVPNTTEEQDQLWEIWHSQLPEVQVTSDYPTGAVLHIGSGESAEYAKAASGTIAEASPITVAEPVQIGGKSRLADHLASAGLLESMKAQTVKGTAPESFRFLPPASLKPIYSTTLEFKITPPVDADILTDETPEEDAMSSLFDNFFGDKFTSSPKKPHTGVYTGVLERYEVTPEYLVIAVNEKGKPVALLAGDQILPFEVVRISDAMTKAHAADYDKNKQGRLLHIRGERPKGR